MSNKSYSPTDQVYFAMYKGDLGLLSYPTFPDEQEIIFPNGLPASSNAPSFTMPINHFEPDFMESIMHTPKRKIFAGIGSRETPKEILIEITKLSRMLAEKGWILRSGGAQGADIAFEEGYEKYPNLKEIYLPWKKFNVNCNPILTSPTNEAMNIASTYHPAWSACKQPARLLLGRNTHQILGVDCATPCNIVICWTKNGKIEGGTGQAIRVAKAFNIPVMNLADCNYDPKTIH